MFAELIVIMSLGFASLDQTPVSTATVLLAEDGQQHGKNEIQKLGRKKIGDYTVSVVMIGEAEAGAKAKFDIKLIDAKTDPKALRVWIGKEDVKAEGKLEATKGENTYTAEVPVPAELSTAVVWVEIETEAGTSRASYLLQQHDHKH